MQHQLSAQAGSLGLLMRRGVAALACGLLTASVAAAELPPGPRAVRWTLGPLAVQSAGQKSAVSEGTFIRDYTVEASAVGDDPELIPQGSFRMTLSVFSPKFEIGDQDPGQWYVTGRWELIDDNADHSASGRTIPGTLSGVVNVELPYNPAALGNRGKSWDSSVRVPLTAFLPVGQTGLGQNVRGDGSIAFGGNSESALSLQLKIYPAVE